MPFIRRHVRLTSGGLPGRRRGSRLKRSGGTGGSRKKRSLTEAQIKEITAALLAKWERESVGVPRKRGARPRLGDAGIRSGTVSAKPKLDRGHCTDPHEHPPGADRGQKREPDVPSKPKAQKLAYPARLPPREPQKRSTSLRAVSGGLPTLGKRRR
jgi:hypothetical protein